MTYRNATYSTYVAGRNNWNKVNVCMYKTTNKNNNVKKRKSSLTSSVVAHWFNLILSTSSLKVRIIGENQTKIQKLMGWPTMAKNRLELETLDK